MRERLTGLLADWGAELSHRAQGARGKARAPRRARGRRGRDARATETATALRKRVEGQDTLIETLQGDAEEASKLRTEVRNKDLEFERVSSELESKKELVRALRRDAESLDRLKGDAKVKDREIERVESRAARKPRATRRASIRGDQLAARQRGRSGERGLGRARSRARGAGRRKTLIKSLRADQDRVGALEASLEEKREVIEQLEASINRHSNTIAELKRSAETWKRKYQSLKGASPTRDVRAHRRAQRYRRARNGSTRKDRRFEDRFDDRHRHAPLAARGPPHGNARQRRKVALRASRAARAVTRAAIRMPRS